MQQPAEGNGSPLTLKPKDEQSLFRRFKLRMGADIAPERSHLVLISLFFVTGLVDSMIHLLQVNETVADLLLRLGASYNIWRCFVSMQTGTSN